MRLNIKHTASSPHENRELSKEGKHRLDKKRSLTLHFEIEQFKHIRFLLSCAVQV